MKEILNEFEVMWNFYEVGGTDLVDCPSTRAEYMMAAAIAAEPSPRY